LVSDAELVARVRRGDVEAFGTLVQRYERSLLAFGLAKLRDLHRAEDVVQQTLLLAFRQLHTLRDDCKFGHWLNRIAATQIVEMARARQIPIGASLDDSKNVSADEANSAWIEHEHLLDLIARLPDHERALIGQRYFDGHSMTEIAAITGRPVGTVTKQLSRAVARLRSWCDQENLR
jgi:RNA polymerase sigma-70 factor, ECF subfamily